MKQLIELSVRGSLYFYLSTVSEKQLFQLQQFASQFYRSSPSYKFKSDDEIMRLFTIAARQTFGIELKNIPVTTVLVIK